MRFTQRVHLFPSRTQKLSSVVPKILEWRRSGKIGIRQHTTRRLASAGLFCCIRGDILRDFPLSWKSRELTVGDTQYSPTLKRVVQSSCSFFFRIVKGRAEELECLTHHDTIVGKIGIRQHIAKRSIPLNRSFCYVT